MTVIKNKGMNWKTYLMELVEFGTKLSELEKIEFSGYLLRRDMESDNRVEIFNSIMASYDYDLTDMISDFLTVESPDSIEDLHRSLKKYMVNYYSNEMNYLIEEATKIKNTEKALENPNDEYDPNDTY